MISKFPNRDEQVDTIINVITAHFNINKENLWKPYGSDLEIMAKKIIIWICFDTVRGVTEQYLMELTSLSRTAIRNHKNTRISVLRTDDVAHKEFTYLKSKCHLEMYGA